MAFPTYTSVQVPVGGVEPWGICYDDNGSIWSCDFNAGNLLKIDVATRAVIDTIPLPAANQCCYDAGTNSIWVTNGLGALRVVSKFDATSNTLIGTYLVGSGLGFPIDPAPQAASRRTVRAREQRQAVAPGDQ